MALLIRIFDYSDGATCAQYLPSSQLVLVLLSWTLSDHKSRALTVTSVHVNPLERVRRALEFDALRFVTDDTGTVPTHVRHLLCATCGEQYWSNPWAVNSLCALQLLVSPSPNTGLQKPSDLGSLCHRPSHVHATVSRVQ